MQYHDLNSDTTSSDNNKKTRKFNKSYLIVFIILLATIGYIVYLKFFKKEGLQNFKKASSVTEVTQSPVTQVTEVTQSPVTQSPVTQVTEVTQSPVTQSPVTQSPVTQVTEVTQSPVTEVTQSPVTQSPVTQVTEVTPIGEEPDVEEIPSSSKNSYEVEETQESVTKVWLLTLPSNHKINSSIENEIQGLYEMQLTDKYLRDHPDATIDSLGISDNNILDSRIKFINENGFVIEKSYDDPNDPWWTINNPERGTILQNPTLNIMSGWLYYNSNSQYHSASHNELVGGIDGFVLLRRNNT
jgi:hypothetical protein